MGQPNPWRRTATKSLTYRLLSTTALFLLAWAITGDATLGGTMAAVQAAITLLVLYPLHEWWWEHRQ